MSTLKIPKTVTLRKIAADSDTGESTYEVRALGGVSVETIDENTARVASQPGGIAAALGDPSFEERARNEQRQQREADLQTIRGLRADGAVEVEICNHGGIKVRWAEAGAAKGSADTTG